MQATTAAQLLRHDPCLPATPSMPQGHVKAAQDKGQEHQRDSEQDEEHGMSLYRSGPWEGSD
ncbi:hypothetical protein [Novosphingobium guangzhouense]|uniref:hypothetical protein n=1 Tax=Novosphingobium guangzhouense TaxID=1850347 RepID=UPI001FEA2652|nr:hypothetical protein [Novosphingobium guangzhouense]